MDLTGSQNFDIVDVVNVNAYEANRRSRARLRQTTLTKAFEGGAANKWRADTTAVGGSTKKKKAAGRKSRRPKGTKREERRSGL
jgi:hypothetical protein